MNFVAKTIYISKINFFSQQKKADFVSALLGYLCGSERSGADATSIDISELPMRQLREV